MRVWGLKFGVWGWEFGKQEGQHQDLLERGFWGEDMKNAGGTPRTSGLGARGLGVGLVA